MNSLLFMTHDDFGVMYDKVLRTNILTTAITQGMSMVLFYSPQTPASRHALQLFKQFPMHLGCTFAAALVTGNLIQKAQMTNTPITYVPYIILYYNGVPKLEYRGDKTIADVVAFITQVTQHFTNNTASQFFQKSNNVHPREKMIPAFSIGRPKCDDDVCYIEFNDAYKDGVQVTSCTVPQQSLMPTRDRAVFDTNPYSQSVYGVAHQYLNPQQTMQKAPQQTYQPQVYNQSDPRYNYGR